MPSLSHSLLIRQARLVPVGADPDGQPDDPVDLRIVDGVITEVGPQLSRAAGEEELDAAGRWAVPGLWDHHVHFTQWSATFGRLDLSGCDSAAAATRVVGDHVAGLGSAPEPVIGFGHRSAGWASPPTVSELDAVSGERPVVLVSGDGHHGWLNSAALRSLGVPPRESVLEETQWFPVFARLADLPSRHDIEQSLRLALERAAAKGITGVVDMEFGPGHRDWPQRVARGLDLVRARPATYAEGLDDVLHAGLSTGMSLGESGLVSMGPLKIIFDGSLNTRTAYCHEPYADAAALATPRGALNLTVAELTGLLARAHEAGLEVAVHAIGDAAAALALDAFEQTGARGSIEHAQFVAPADVPRLGRLGVRASVQPAHLWDDRDVTMQCWPDRADSCFRLRSLLQAGVTLALGSDAPVAPLDPWLAMAAAVHRSADEREPWNPAESLTPAQALAASTDGHRGLRVGSPGDVVLLDRDPLAVHDDTATAAHRLRTMPVANTVLAGRITHS